MLTSKLFGGATIRIVASQCWFGAFLAAADIPRLEVRFSKEDTYIGERVSVSLLFDSGKESTCIVANDSSPAGRANYEHVYVNGVLAPRLTARQSAFFDPRVSQLALGYGINISQMGFPIQQASHHEPAQVTLDLYNLLRFRSSGHYTIAVSSTRMVIGCAKKDNVGGLGSDNTIVLTSNVVPITVRGLTPEEEQRFVTEYIRAIRTAEPSDRIEAFKSLDALDTKEGIKVLLSCYLDDSCGLPEEDMRSALLKSVNGKWLLEEKQLWPVYESSSQRGRTLRRDLERLWMNRSLQK